mgnify:CR=1 FL=1
MKSAIIAVTVWIYTWFTVKASALTHSQFIALKAAMPWLDINQERHHAYMGYIGMVKLTHAAHKLPKELSGGE